MLGLKNNYLQNSISRREQQLQSKKPQLDKSVDSKSKSNAHRNSRDNYARPPSKPRRQLIDKSVPPQSAKGTPPPAPRAKSQNIPVNLKDSKKNRAQVSVKPLSKKINVEKRVSQKFYWHSKKKLEQFSRFN